MLVALIRIGSIKFLGCFLFSSFSCAHRYKNDLIDNQWIISPPLERGLEPLTSLSSSSHHGDIIELLLPANSLQTSTQYTFTLKSSLQAYPLDQGIGSISLITNSPPNPGHLVVKPSSGIALNTIFKLQATQWEDSDIPLMYQFGFKSQANKDIFLTGLNSVQSISTEFSAGDNIECFVLVEDTLAASSS